MKQSKMDMSTLEELECLQKDLRNTHIDSYTDVVADAIYLLKRAASFIDGLDKREYDEERSSLLRCLYPFISKVSDPQAESKSSS